MKQVFTLSFLLLAFSLFSQEKVVTPAENNTNGSTQAAEPTRTAASSTQIRSTAAVKSAFDLDDRYMGRTAEFLANLTVTQLPSDFPVYEKQWSLREYNQVVTAFYRNHMDIVRESVKKKLKITPEN